MENLYGRLYAEKQFRIIPNPVMEKVAYMPIVPGDCVLEVGATNTDVMSHVRQKGGIYTGIDINPVAIGRVKKEEPNENFVVADVRHLPFENDSFDKVVSIHTLEHVRYLSEAFAELYRVTKKGGQNIHIFPDDYFFKEESAIGDAFRVHPFNPVKAVRLARSLHQYKITPREIRKNMTSAPFGASAYDNFQVRSFPLPRWNIYLRLFKF